MVFKILQGKVKVPILKEHLVLDKEELSWCLVKRLKHVRMLAVWAWPRLRRGTHQRGLRSKLDSRNREALEEDCPLWILVKYLPESCSRRESLTCRSKINVPSNAEIPCEATQKVIDRPIARGRELCSSSTLVNAVDSEAFLVRCDLTADTNVINDGGSAGKDVEVAFLNDDRLRPAMMTV